MRLTERTWFVSGLRNVLGVFLLMGLAQMMAVGQAVATTTVQGTVYLANGHPGSGSLTLSWPAFTTAQNQLVVAGTMTVTIGTDGFLSINLAPNQGASPAGLFYNAIYHMSDGTTSTQYWLVPATAQATIASVQSQVMPAAQAVHAVSQAYVDQAIQELSGSLLGATGGQMTGPLYLIGDPTLPIQAADKHYVDASFALAVPLTGAALTGPLTSIQLGAAYQVDQFSGADFGGKLQACINGLSPTYGGTCDARNFTSTVSMGSNLIISAANVTVDLPCATISSASQVIVTAGTRNVALHGCSLRGASTASGSQGGTVLLYTGTGAAVQVGDSTYAADTPGFHMDNVLINTTASSSASTQGFAAYRTQEIELTSSYFLGNSNQTGITLDGTGNYTGGSFLDNQISGFQTAVNAIGHQIANAATTDWMNASTFVRLHIDCPTSGGSPVAGSFGINLQQGDGNTFTGGDIEGCATALHLGANAQNNTLVGVRNENSTHQVVADAGSSYNNWMTGGTMLTGQLTDNGTRNSFLDTFHRSFNGLNGDWYGSQQDATVTNHYRLGIGSGNERGLLNRYQTDFGYRWTTGLSDATAGEQFYQVLDELNSVYRISIGQYNNGQSSTNNQTVINAAGTGAVVLNGSTSSGTGGVLFGSGGASGATVATINNSGNAQFNGTLLVGGTAQSTGTLTVRNNTDAEVDYYLWPGLTASQKGSFTYKDWNGNSQWYMVKDNLNNWALNSAVGNLDSFKAYQSTNSGDTYINASNATGHIRLNYETGAGAETDIYSGSSANLVAAFLGTTAIKFPGLAAGSGHYCMQVDTSGYITNTGTACGAGGSTNGTVNSGTVGQIAYYNTNGAVVSGTATVPVAAGGTGASTASAALTSLGGVPLSGGTLTGAVQAPNLPISVTAPAYGAKCDGVTNDSAAFLAADAVGVAVQIPSGTGHSCVIGSTIALNSTYIINQGGGIAPASGVTVTMAHTPQAGLYQIFSGAGHIYFSNPPVVYPEWWGASPLPTIIGGAPDTYPALSAACSSLTYLNGTPSQLLYSGNYARVGTIKFASMVYRIGTPWTCSYGVSYTNGNEQGQFTLWLTSGAVASKPATETFAFFADPPVSSGQVMTANTAFGTRIKGMNIYIDGNHGTSTTLGAAITTTGTQTVTVASVAGLSVGNPIYVDSASSAEAVVPTAVGASTITATFAKTHANGAQIYSSMPNNYVSGLFVAMAQGSSVENVGVSYAWGRGCVLVQTPTVIDKDQISCSDTLNGPNFAIGGVGSLDFVDSTNSNYAGMLGQVEVTLPLGVTTYTIPFAKGFIAGSSRVQYLGGTSGTYSGVSVPLAYLTKIASGSPTQGQYVEGTNGVLTFNSSDAYAKVRIYYMDMAPIVAANTGVKPVPGVQIDAESSLNINQLFCEGDYDCLNTYQAAGLSINNLEAHPGTSVTTGTAAVYLDANTQGVVMPNQKYFNQTSTQKWTYGVDDQAHSILRTLSPWTIDTYDDFDNYSPGLIATGSSLGMIYPDGTSTTVDPTGKLTAITSIPATGVGAGSCTNCNLSYGADGRITVAASGLATGTTAKEVYSISRTGLTGSDSSSTVIWTPTAAGQYRITVSYYCSTTGTGGTAYPAITFTSAASAANPTGGTISLSASNSTNNFVYGFWAVAGQPIKYQMFVSGVTGSPQYGVAVVLEQF